MLMKDYMIQKQKQSKLGTGGLKMREILFRREANEDDIDCC